MSHLDSIHASSLHYMYFVCATEDTDTGWHSYIILYLSGQLHRFITKSMAEPGTLISVLWKNHNAII